MEKTHWTYEYGMKLPDGTFEFANNGYPWSRKEAEQKVERWNQTAYGLKLKDWNAKTVRRKITTTVITRLDAWEDAR